MPNPVSDRILPFVFPVAETSASSPDTTDLEQEVVALFDQFRNRALRYVLALRLSVQDGEEITQEVFLALHRHLQLGKSRENLPGWIFRVAHNLALKRRAAARKFCDTREAFAGWEVNRLDPAPNPEEQLASSQRRERLLAVVQVLPEQDQHCLQLRAEGLRYREIAEVLGMSLGAVSISLSRSLARLGRADER